MRSHAVQPHKQLSSFVPRQLWTRRVDGLCASEREMITSDLVAGACIGRPSLLASLKRPWRPNAACSECLVMQDAAGYRLCKLAAVQGWQE